ncbi:MFS transporter [Paenibacillus polymyxa]|uniref:glycoside-pentoside-hexuronide (GPH):cation symporter n=1 Tax=Paenibacillus polymyxa TaxID=1406 RepID=UPI001F5A97AF|nr:glycoside-pentoside-hexuronide (GPH):cation symporter [Paenibacillus polymyxa]UNL92902.1 MFS transporter [Paenibacillus polymyxa]
MLTSASAKNNDKVSLKTLISYSLSSYGMNVIYNLTAVYLMFFYTDSFGLNALAVGTLLMVARVIDAVVDIFIGIAVDNTNTRWGKFRPYMFIGAFLVTLTTLALFLSPDLSSAGKLVYAYVTYIAWSISYSILDIPYWSLSAAITKDAAERTKVVTVPRTVASAGLWTVNVVALPLVHFFNGWAGAVAVLCGLFFVCMMFTVFGVKEKHVVPRHEKQTLKGVLRLFFIENRPLRLLIISFFIIEMTANIRNAFTLYYFKYNLGAEAFIPLFMGLTVGFQIAGNVAVPFIAKWIGKKVTSIAGVLITSISMIALFFCGNSIVLVFILSCIISFGVGLNYVVMSTMLADCVDYGEWKTGNRSEGMVFSANVFRAKLAAAIGSAVGGYALALAGYQPNIVQTNTTLIWLTLLFTIIPGVLTFLSVFPMKNYELTETMNSKIVQEVRARREQGEPSVQ